MNGEEKRRRGRTRGEWGIWWDREVRRDKGSIGIGGY
jgi:hypothetical protein